MCWVHLQLLPWVVTRRHPVVFSLSNGAWFCASAGRTARLQSPPSQPVRLHLPHPGLCQAFAGLCLWPQAGTLLVHYIQVTVVTLVTRSASNSYFKLGFFSIQIVMNSCQRLYITTWRQWVWGYNKPTEKLAVLIDSSSLLKYLIKLGYLPSCLNFSESVRLRPIFAAMILQCDKPMHF